LVFSKKTSDNRLADVTKKTGVNFLMRFQQVFITFLATVPQLFINFASCLQPVKKGLKRLIISLQACQ